MVYNPQTDRELYPALDIMFYCRVATELLCQMLNFLLARIPVKKGNYDLVLWEAEIFMFNWAVTNKKVKFCL